MVVADSSSETAKLTWVQDDNLSRDTVETIIHRNPVILSPETPVSDAIAAMHEAQETCVLAVKQQNLVGILTERDVVRAISYGVSPAEVPVSVLMSRDILTLQVREIKSFLQLTQLFKQYRIRHVPILDDFGQILGIITPWSIRDRLRPEHFLRYVKVAEVMIENAVTISPELTLLDISRRMMLYNVSCLVILDDAEMPVGIITTRDLVQFHSCNLDFKQVSAEAVMSTPLCTVQPQDSLWTAHQRMTELRVRRLVVVDTAGKLAGIVAQTQVLKMCNPNELHAVMHAMQQVIDRQNQQLISLTQDLEAKNAELQQLATIDELTQIYNRRHFNTYIHQQWQRLIPLSRPIALIMIDIDKFKQFNDTYGHVAGDQCLQRLARGFWEIVSPRQGALTRLGGEEFVVALPETDLAEAEPVAQRMLQYVQQLQIPHTNSDVQYVSISLGVTAVVPTPEMSVEDLLQRVDRLLYQAKRQGGNACSLDQE